MLAPPRDPHRERDDLEALVREARARQRRRWMIVAVVVAALAGAAARLYAL